MINIERRLQAIETQVAPAALHPAVEETIRLSLGRELTAAERREAAQRFPRWIDLLQAAQRPRPPDGGEPAPTPEAAAA